MVSCQVCHTTGPARSVRGEAVVARPASMLSDNVKSAGRAMTHWLVTGFRWAYKIRDTQDKLMR